MSSTVGTDELFPSTAGFLRERDPGAESLVARLVFLATFEAAVLGPSDDK